MACLNGARRQNDVVFKGVVSESMLRLMLLQVYCTFDLACWDILDLLSLL